MIGSQRCCNCKQWVGFRCHNCFGEEVETTEQYRTRVVEEACEALNAEANARIVGERAFAFYEVSTRDAGQLIADATNRAWSPDRDNDADMYLEAEALLRCGWRPEGWE